MTPQEFAAWWPAPDTAEEIAAADAREIAESKRCEGCGAADIATCSCDYLEEEDDVEMARRLRG
jgi:hypothetical protein